jgi:hypothetical protein
MTVRERNNSPDPGPVTNAGACARAERWRRYKHQHFVVLSDWPRKQSSTQINPVEEALS